MLDSISLIMAGISFVISGFAVRLAYVNKKPKFGLVAQIVMTIVGFLTIILGVVRVVVLW